MPDSTEIDEFMRWVDRTANSKVPAIFSYIAHKERGTHGLVLVKGALALNRLESPVGPEIFATDDMVAGWFAVDHAQLLDFCANLTSGVVHGRDGSPIRMVYSGEHRLRSLQLLSSNEGATYQQNQPDVYRLKGREHQLPLGESTGWKLRAAEPPFDSLLDLQVSYLVGHVDDESTVDIVAFPTAAIDGRSAVSDKGAELVVTIQDGLDPQDFRLGYRVVAADQSIRERGNLAGDVMQWTREGNLIVGTAGVAASPNDVVNCYAIYRGVAQHRAIAFNPKLLQNPRRVAYEIFDPGLAKLQACIKGEGKKKQDDLEWAVSCLGWLLGFSPFHFERDFITESPDVFLLSSNAFVVVECTIGAFSGEKVAKLRGRADAVHQRLRDSGHAGAEVHAVMASTLEGAATEASRKVAINHGVSLFSQAEIAQLMGQTVLFPDASARVSEWANQATSQQS